MGKTSRAEDERGKESKKAGKSKQAKDAMRARRRKPAKETTTLAGRVADVFGRRFTLEADGARMLVDLGRRGAALTCVAAGAHVIVIGQRKNGEIKAWALRDEADGRTRLLRKERQARKLAAAREGTDDAPAATNAGTGA